MKCVLLFLAVCSYTFLYVQSTSPVLCTGECDKANCPSAGNCECGTHLDDCKCCSFCNKCPGEECSIVANDVCAPGYLCMHTEERSGPDYFNMPGICMKEQNII